MSKVARVLVLISAYYLLLFISSCCDSSDAVITGNINTVVLLDYDSNPEAINNNVIRTGFRLVYFPETAFVFHDNPFLNQAYGQNCSNEVINNIDDNSVKLSFNKDVRVGTQLIPAGTDLLSSAAFSSVELDSDCLVSTQCEITIGFPTPLVNSMEVTSGDLIINFVGNTDDGQIVLHEFNTTIDLQ